MVQHCSVRCTSLCVDRERVCEGRPRGVFWREAERVVDSKGSAELGCEVNAGRGGQGSESM